MDRRTEISRVLLIFMLCLVTSGEIFNVIESGEFDQIKKSREIVAVAFVRSDPYDQVFQNHFRDAGIYLQDFGVLLGTVNCLSDPVAEYCVKASNNVFIFRYGSFLLDLPYDTLFGVDAIVANILHLVLLSDAPIISDQADLQEKQNSNLGKRDIIFGYIPAVGIKGDRVFMEIAFAYRHQYAFITTTNRDLLHGADGKKPSVSQLPDAEVGVLQCQAAKPDTRPGSDSDQACPWAKYHGPVSTESLALMMKTLSQPAVIDVTKHQPTNPYEEHGIPAVYAVTDPTNHKQALDLVMATKDDFRGSVGFVVIDQENLSDPALLPEDMDCIPACFVLRGHTEDFFADDVKDSAGLRAFVNLHIHSIFSYLQDTIPKEEDYQIEDESEISDIEQQDDRVQQAVVHLRSSFYSEESIVPSLTDVTFPQFTANTHLTGVLFTMLWNPRSLAFLEPYQLAAESIMSIFDSDYKDSPLARVECSDWPDVCDKNNVTVYPTVKMFKGESDGIEFGGNLNKQSILESFVLLKLASPVYFESATQVGELIQGSFPAQWAKDLLSSFTLAIIPSKFSQEKAVFLQVAQDLRSEHLLGVCTAKCAEEMQASLTDGQPSVTMYRWTDPHNPQQSFKKAWTQDNLEKFVRDASLPILPELTAASMPRYLSLQKPFVILFHTGDPISEKAAHSLRQIATSENYHQFILCYMDSSEESSVGFQAMSTYGLLRTSGQSIVVMLDHAAGEVCRFPHSNDPSVPHLAAWLQATQQGDKQCSEARALVDREWRPLVAPYDYLKLMEDEDHVGSGRRGLSHPEAASQRGAGREERTTPPQGEQAAPPPTDTAHHKHPHVEL